MLRAVFLIPLWAGIFGSQPNKSKSFTEGYGYAIKVGVLNLLASAKVSPRIVLQMIPWLVDDQSLVKPCANHQQKMSCCLFAGF